VPLTRRHHPRIPLLRGHHHRGREAGVPLVPLTRRHHPRITKMCTGERTRFGDGHSSSFTGMIAGICMTGARFVCSMGAVRGSSYMCGPETKKFSLRVSFFTHLGRNGDTGAGEIPVVSLLQTPFSISTCCGMESGRGKVLSMTGSGRGFFLSGIRRTISGRGFLLPGIRRIRRIIFKRRTTAALTKLTGST